MSSGNTRQGAGCFLKGCLGVVVLAVCLAVFFAIVGVLAGTPPTGPGVAVFDVFGVMMDEQGLLDQLDRLVEDPGTRAVVVRVDSPGGLVTVAEEVYNALNRVREKGIPVVASVGMLGASGGYFVCLAADHVFVNRGSLTGSIGVITVHPSVKELCDRLGIQVEVIASGEFKSTGIPTQPLTDRQREEMQSVIGDLHAFFVEIVAAGRHMDPEQARQLADGRVFTGRQALEAGLADEIGDLHAAIGYAAKQAGIEGEPRIIRIEERWPFLLDAVLHHIRSFAGSAMGRYVSMPMTLMR